MIDDRRPSPFPIRLTEAERAKARDRAARQGISLAALFRSVLDKPDPRGRLNPAERTMLAQLMAHLGKIGSNVNQLAFQANSGSWPDHFAIEEAAADIRWMRDTVMATLGITPPTHTGIASAGPPLP